MTKFELRYGSKTAITEYEGTLEEFVEELGSSGWWFLGDEPIAIQVRMINSVKTLEKVIE